MQRRLVFVRVSTRRRLNSSVVHFTLREHKVLETVLHQHLTMQDHEDTTADVTDDVTICSQDIALDTCVRSDVADADDVYVECVDSGRASMDVSVKTDAEDSSLSSDVSDTSQVETAVNMTSLLVPDSPAHAHTPELANGSVLRPKRSSFRHSLRSRRHSTLTRTLSIASHTGELQSQRVFLTVVIYITFFVLGLVGNLIGTTMVHMQHLLDTDIKGMTLTFVFQRVGYLLGVVLSGLLFDRLNQEMQFAVASLVEGVAVAVAPFVSHVRGYYVAMSLQALVHGYINTGLQSFLFGLWDGRKYKSPIMQASPALWSIGSAICPFIIRPFLVDIPETDVTRNVIVSRDEYAYSSSVTYVENTTAYTADVTLVYSGDLNRVRFPYVIVGSILASLSVLYVVAYWMIGPECNRKVLRSDKRFRRKVGDRTRFRVPMLVMLFFFFLFYAWYEGIFSSLLTAFVIEGLEWPVSSGPLIVVVFFSSHAVGRILGIPISFKVSSTKMITTSLLVTTSAFTLLLFAPRSDTQTLVWVAVALAGLAMATIYASMMVWTSRYMTITSAAGAVFLVGGSTGGMTGGALIGWLFQTQTYMWVIYMALLACLMHLALFLAMFLFTRHFKRKHSKAKENSEVRKELSRKNNGCQPQESRIVSATVEICETHKPESVARTISVST